MEPLKTERIVWPLILPYLSLCDLQLLSQTSPLLSEFVGDYIHLHGVQIEECCLKTTPEIFKKFADNVSILTLISLPEGDAHKLIGHFKKIKSLTLVNMIILDETHMATLPLGITDLILLDSKIEKKLLERWFTQLKKKLRKLHLKNFECDFTARKNRYGSEWLLPLKNLKSLTIDGNTLCIDYTGPHLKFLKIRSNNSRDIRVEAGSDCNLLELHYDVPGDDWEEFKYYGYSDSVRKLTTRSLIPLEMLEDFYDLERLEVLLPVDLQYKEELEAMNVKTLKVVYNPASQPPKETNLIFKKLNDDCLVEIIKRLEVHEWISLGRVHPKIEKILAEHFFSRFAITDKVIDESKIYEDLPHFQKVAHFITEYECDWKLKHLPVLQNRLTALTSLTIHDVFFIDSLVDVMPNGLEKLVLDDVSFEDDIDLAPYFKRLNPTLRVLVVKAYNSPSFNFKWLGELHNVREFKIESQDNYTKLASFLKRNMSSLERVEMDVGELPLESGWAALEGVLELIGSMKKLKVFGIQNFVSPPAVNGHLVARLIEKVGHQLKKLTVDCEPEIIQVLEHDLLADLQELNIHVFDDTWQRALNAIATKKNLRKIHIQLYTRSDEETTLPATDLLFLASSLPKLTAIETRLFEGNLRSGVDFTEYLRREKRTIKINGVKYPWT